MERFGILYDSVQSALPFSSLAAILITLFISDEFLMHCMSHVVTFMGHLLIGIHG